MGCPSTLLRITFPPHATQQSGKHFYPEAMFVCTPYLVYTCCCSSAVLKATYSLSLFDNWRILAQSLSWDERDGHKLVRRRPDKTGKAKGMTRKQQLPILRSFSVCLRTVWAFGYSMAILCIVRETDNAEISTGQAINQRGSGHLPKGVVRPPKALSFACPEWKIGHLHMHWNSVNLWAIVLFLARRVWSITLLSTFYFSVTRTLAPVDPPPP